VDRDYELELVYENLAAVQKRCTELQQEARDARALAEVRSVIIGLLAEELKLTKDILDELVSAIEADVPKPDGPVN